MSIIDIRKRKTLVSTSSICLIVKKSNKNSFSYFRSYSNSQLYTKNIDCMASSYSIGPSSKQRKVGIFWLDSEVNNSEENLSAQQQLYNSFNNVEIFENEAQCHELIRSNSNQPVFLIVSGQLSRKIVPAIESLGQVIGIYIYCMNESRHIDWAKGFPKVRLLLSSFCVISFLFRSKLSSPT